MLAVALWLNNQQNTPFSQSLQTSTQARNVQLANLARGVKNVVAVTVQSSGATQILGANPYRKGARIFNNSGVIVYLGKDSTVTTSTGLPLAINTGFIDDLGSADAWWGIAASSTADVRAIEYN